MNNAEKKMIQFCDNILDYLHIGIMASHIDGTICYMNEIFATMFGFNRRIAIGDHICNYFPGSELLNVMKSRKQQVRVLFKFKGKEAFISRYPVFDGAACVGGYVEAYFRDIHDLSPLLARIQTLEQKAEYFERRAKATQPKAVFSFNSLVGDSEAIRRLKKQGTRFANSNQPILITGESGTGKELIANALHAASPRAHNAFICVNCAAIPSELMEAELFGYAEGSFTGASKKGRIGKFELADGGTIFLDEVAEIPMNMQAKLLRILESHEIQKIGSNRKVHSDFRVLAATNKDLRQMAHEGVFRMDLYHRLSVLQLHTPPLRERLDDLDLLVPELLKQIAQQEHCPMPDIDSAIFPVLRKYYWPGNVRELKNILIYTCFSQENGWGHVTPCSLPSHLFDVGMDGAHVEGSLKEQCRHYMRMVIERTLVRCKGNKTLTARELKLSRNELYKKIKEMGIDVALGKTVE
ncbi:sigma-54 interaction domain-containing protein [Desulfovibrio sp. SGI.169]|uniref:sigma-54 interaction domain-containing protein n=1 Tax=Desulfovibrio sp. SGI.169 TaxID=3420561 RepID=UPI003D067ADE